MMAQPMRRVNRPTLARGKPASASRRTGTTCRLRRLAIVGIAEGADRVKVGAVEVEEPAPGNHRDRVAEGGPRVRRDDELVALRGVLGTDEVLEGRDVSRTDLGGVVPDHDATVLEVV